MSSGGPAGTDERRSTADLQDLVASMSGPIGAMLSTFGQGAVTIVQHLLDQAYAAGRSRGRADAEYRVAHAVGAPTIQNGVGGTWMRCAGCAGDGLVFQPAPQPGPVGNAHRAHPSQAQTEVIPRISGEADTAQFRLDRLRQPPPGR